LAAGLCLAEQERNAGEPVDDRRLEVAVIRQVALIWTVPSSISPSRFDFFFVNESTRTRRQCPFRFERKTLDLEYCLNNQMTH
jgi:hypothetical protein